MALEQKRRLTVDLVPELRDPLDERAVEFGSSNADIGRAMIRYFLARPSERKELAVIARQMRQERADTRAGRPPGKAVQKKQ